jgi:polysaccharide export outer membrane protein
MQFRAIVGVSSLCAVMTLNALAEDPKATKPSSGVASAEYRLGPEDLLLCFVYKEPELTTTVVVRPDGMISLPMAGLIQATGKTTTELETAITSKLHEFVGDPVVTVIVKEINSPKVSVLGQVNKPDVFPIRQRMTVLNAIALAGGFTEFAKKDRVLVIREGLSRQETIKLNLKKLSKDGAPFYLQPTDTVFVE